MLTIINVETSIHDRQPDGSYWLKETYTRSDGLVFKYNTLINSDIDLQNIISIRSDYLCKEEDE